MELARAFADRLRDGVADQNRAGTDLFESRIEAAEIGVSESASEKAVIRADRLAADRQYEAAGDVGGGEGRQSRLMKPADFIVSEHAALAALAPARLVKRDENGEELRCVALRAFDADCAKPGGGGDGAAQLSTAARRNAAFEITSALQREHRARALAAQFIATAAGRRKRGGGGPRRQLFEAAGAPASLGDEIDEAGQGVRPIGIGENVEIVAERDAERHEPQVVRGCVFIKGKQGDEACVVEHGADAERPWRELPPPGDQPSGRLERRRRRRPAPQVPPGRLQRR